MSFSKKLTAPRAPAARLREVRFSLICLVDVDRGACVFVSLYFFPSSSFNFFILLIRKIKNNIKSCMKISDLKLYFCVLVVCENYSLSIYFDEIHWLWLLLTFVINISRDLYIYFVFIYLFCLYLYGGFFYNSNMKYFWK